jgi:rubrerythrin
MDVFAFAMKMEQDGKSYYLQLAAGTSISGLKTIFAMLAEDEQKHYDVIQTLKDYSVADNMANSTALKRHRIFLPTDNRQGYHNHNG